MSSSEQFIGKPKSHQDNNKNIDKCAKLDWQYYHEESNKVKVYQVSMTIISWVLKQRRVYDCSHNGQQIITCQSQDNICMCTMTQTNAQQ